MICTRVRRASDVVGTPSRRRARWLWPLLAACLVALAHASNAAAQVSYEVVADLGTIGGAEPLGGLIAGSDGALYGTASRGGAGNCGLVYRIDAVRDGRSAPRLRRHGRVPADGRARRRSRWRLLRRHVERWRRRPDGLWRDDLQTGARRHAHGAAPVHRFLRRSRAVAGCRPGPRPRCWCIPTATSTARRVRVTSSGSCPTALRFSSSSSLARRESRTPSTARSSCTLTGISMAPRPVSWCQSYSAASSSASPSRARQRSTSSGGTACPRDSNPVRPGRYHASGPGDRQRRRVLRRHIARRTDLPVRRPGDDLPPAAGWHVDHALHLRAGSG